MRACTFCVKKNHRPLRKGAFCLVLHKSIFFKSNEHLSLVVLKDIFNSDEKL